VSKIYRQLILCPEDPNWIASSFEELQYQLSEIGLLGEKFAEIAHEGRTNQQHYVGDNFLQHINFMGCAPAVEFQPLDGDVGNLESFTFVHLVEAYEQPKWLAELMMAKPACPNCKKRFANSEQHLDLQTQMLTCPHCNTESDAALYNWKEFGGAARTLVSIVNAYPKETIPSSNLLIQLQQSTGTNWHFFYYLGDLLK